MNAMEKVKYELEMKTVSTVSDIQKLGISKMMITYYVKENKLVRCGTGLYSLPDTIVDEMYMFSLQSNKVIFSHESALFLNGLSDRMPFEYTVTVPQNRALSPKMRVECTCFYVKEKVYLLGVIEKKTPFGNLVRCYDAERTICDLLKNRNRIDEETITSGLRNYAKMKNKDLYKLGNYAQKLNVVAELHKYMGVLL